MHPEKGCTGCLRNSPVASLLGMIIVMIGVGAFSSGNILLSKKLSSLKQYNHLISYAVYGIIISSVIFILMSYFLAAFSTGYNRKRFFEGSRKTKIGRCCTVFNIMCLTLASYLWILVTCFMSFCFGIILFSAYPDVLSVVNVNITVGDYTDNTDNTEIILAGVALGGSITAILGFVKMLCCSTMNFVRLGEERYYEDMSFARHKSDQ